MKAEGAWLFGGALHEAETATVVRVSNGDVLTTDGPFPEAKEHLGRLLHHRGRRPRRRPRMGVEDQRCSREADRGPPLPTRIRGLRDWRTSTASSRFDEAAVGRIFREESGRSIAALIRAFGDIDLAEDAVQEAFAVALRTWARDGLPPNPGGWITTHCPQSSDRPPPPRGSRTGTRQRGGRAHTRERRPQPTGGDETRARRPASVSSSLAAIRRSPPKHR